MALSVGIVGLPNVGKSTLLNALTHAGAEASNYPFCTIDQNVGVAVLPDPDLEKLASILHPTETVPATVRFVDIAGLVEGASRGEGLGNRFLAHIRDVDAILHVVRCFAADEVVHPAGAPDPLRDVAIVETELLLADLEAAQQGLERARKAARRAQAGHEAEAAFARALEALEKGTPIAALALSDAERALLAEARFLTAKPCLYLANTGEDDPEGRGPLARALVETKGAARVLPLSVRIEEEISELAPEEQEAFLRELGLAHTALDLVIAACFRLLDLVTFYTIANEKLRAWPIRRGATAPEAAGRVHSDMQAGFVRAEVMTISDLERLGSRHALHERGLLRTVGHDYVVHDKDVLHFHFRP
jgi:GTP-binding protein YchF